MFVGEARQPSLFGGGEVRFDAGFRGLIRRDLAGGAWVDYCAGWLAADDELFEVVRDRVVWEQPVVRMYDRLVTTPRLVGKVDPTLHPAVGAVSAALSDRYAVALDRIGAGYYRDGADSVAWHGDRIARERPEAVVATVSLAGPRRFLMRPKGSGPALSFSLGHGDLLVMGGSCQRTWDHCVPKTRQAPPRIALMFRPAYDSASTPR